MNLLIVINLDFVIFVRAEIRFTMLKTFHIFDFKLSN